MFQMKTKKTEHKSSWKTNNKCNRLGDDLAPSRDADTEHAKVLFRILKCVQK